MIWDIQTMVHVARTGIVRIWNDRELQLRLILQNLLAPGGGL